MLKLSIHLTTTGFSRDSNFVQDFEVHRGVTLTDLKEFLMDLPGISSLTKDIESTDHVRVREKNSTGFFGKIFREKNKTLKQLNVKDHSSLVVQILAEPEYLDNNTYVLLFSERDI